ncbi:hypothetical protein ACEWY4_026326 [Coilia grayii]|uniref:Uncharacterized protein n=1 Tax=Coilia grayii TaxID=363190 RepID=A0ABD1IUK7_9TELE
MGSRLNMLPVLLSLCVAVLPALTSDMAGQRTVIKGTLTLHSTKTCEGDVGWDLKQGDKYYPVITCRQGQCVVGPRFQNRVQEWRNNLTISPVLHVDEGLYILSCNDIDGIWSVSVNLDPQRSTAVIPAGGNLTIDLCSLDQVKLNFTQKGSSATETLFIIDNGKAFGDPKALGGVGVSVQDDIAVLSNLVQDGMFTVMDSKTGKMLCEVTFTVTGSGDHRDMSKASSGCSWSLSCVGSIVSIVFNIGAAVHLIFFFYPRLQSVIRKCWRKLPRSWGKKRPRASRRDQEKGETHSFIESSRGKGDPEFPRETRLRVGQRHSRKMTRKRHSRFKTIP